MTQNYNTLNLCIVIYLSGSGTNIEAIGPPEGVRPSRTPSCLEGTSREEYGMLEQMGATWQAPRMPKGIENPSQWATWDFDFAR